MIGTKQQSEEMGTSWITEVMEEMRFALQCYGSSKVIIDLPFSKYVHKGFLRLLCNLVERYILYNKIALARRRKHVDTLTGRPGARNL